MPLDYLAAARTAALGFYEYGLLSILVLQAKDEGDTGIIHTSAPALANRWRSLRVKTAQTLLARLDDAGFIARFWNPGQAGVFAVAIDGYIRRVERRWQRLDAKATSDWRKPVYVDVTPASHGSGDGSDRGSGGRSDDGTPIVCIEEEGEGDPCAAAPESPVADAPGGDGPVHLRTRPRRAAPRPKDPKAAEAAPTGPLIELWQSLAAQRGQVQERSYGRHAKVFADLFSVAGQDVAKCAGVIRAYFADDDPFIARHGWSVGTFEGRMRGYLPAVALPAAPAPRPMADVSDVGPPPATKEVAAKFAASAAESLRQGRKTS